MGQRYPQTVIWGNFAVWRREVNIHKGSLMLLFALPQAAVTQRTPDQKAKIKQNVLPIRRCCTIYINILKNKDFLGFLLLNRALLRLLLITNLKR